jgi:SAM-dependent methyltransferase
MSTHTCPWWLGCLLVTPLRRLKENPARILAPYLRPGMIVLEPGPAMGFFTLELARLVGPGGRVVAVDLQEKMLAALRRRAQKAGLAEPLLRQVVHSTPEFVETRRLLAFLEWFLPIETEWVPDNSILREFIGGSILKDFKVWGSEKRASMPPA